MLIFIPEIINDIHGATFTSIVSVLYLAIFPACIIPERLLADILVKSVGVSDAHVPFSNTYRFFIILCEIPCY